MQKKKKGIGIQNMLSRTKECHGEFQIKSKKGEVQLLPLSFQSNKTNTYIEMTIESAANN
jgi:signal transduction histidine kinase